MGLSKPCVLVIVVASVERFAYKGVAANLVTYLTDVAKMSTSSAAKSVNSWCGFTSMLPLLVALLTDSYWDRFSTILVSSLLYVMGLVALTTTSILWPWNGVDKPAGSMSSLFISLYLISVAQGGYNPSLQAFGADQLDIEESPTNKEDEKTTKKKNLFFQWWYFGICTGSLLGVSVMSYIQDTHGWGLGFAIPTIAMGISVMCFTCGARFYIYKQSKVAPNKPVSDIIQTVKEIVAKIVTGRIRLPPREVDLVELEMQDKPLKDDIHGGASLDLTDLNTKLEDPPCLSKVILRLLPTWISLLLFAVVFQQPVTFFTKQGASMKRNIGNFVIPPAMLQGAITISIISLMPLYDKLVIPIARIMTRSDKGITVVQRMAIGMFLSIIAMIVSALVESQRLKISRQQTLMTYQLSIFWLLPQYILLGVSDVFTVVGMQEFFYAQVPSTMKTIGIALYLSVFGVGSFISAFLITVIEKVTGPCGRQHSWFSDDMKEARLDNYYWFLALSSTGSLILFLYSCKKLQ
ncbi:putative peptide/nitrate transporter [Acorus calamus]|uniref:Peptide/nitrate transporter n=1 Tax=Acorus calamus TaxID=4465 RepID=A0AAV9EFC4_ACOCL|nr:putative peptide/nitrate transporter [Acorus calamus]